jgi:hypothetical protein
MRIINLILGISYLIFSVLAFSDIYVTTSNFNIGLLYLIVAIYTFTLFLQKKL